jgi:hypothetical protein
MRSGGAAMTSAGKASSNVNANRGKIPRQLVLSFFTKQLLDTM